MLIQDRIRELRRVPASQLRPNPRNWRTHSKAQLDAIRGVLAEIGFAGAALARELPDLTLELIDGHARTEVSGDSPVPVLILDVTAEEADKILATFDPLGAMAGADSAKLLQILADAQFDSAAVTAMLDELAAANGLAEPEPEEEEPAGVDAIPEAYRILIEFPDEATQARWLEKLTAEGLNCRSLIS